jgi:hypothetical protein
MAWTDTLTYAGPNWEIHEVSASAAGDTVLVVPHSLHRVPLVCFFSLRNDAAAAASVHLENLTDVSVEVHKAPGLGAGMEIDLHLSTLRHPH